MSDYYRFSLNYAIRRDTPVELRSSLHSLASRSLPAETDLATLPPVIASYLRHPLAPEGMDGDGFTYRYSRSGIQFREERPDDPAYHIHIERTFHDDEYWHAGMYFVMWLFQFAATDGHLATELSVYDSPPTIYTRHGDDILQTQLAYHPEEYRPLALRQTSLDAEHPIVIKNTLRQNLRELLEHISWMADCGDS